MYIFSRPCSTCKQGFLGNTNLNQNFEMFDEVVHTLGEADGDII